MTELTSNMTNDNAYRLGALALDAGDRSRPDVGDNIDRGLILLALLKAAGYTVTAKPFYEMRPVAEVIAEVRGGGAWTCPRCSTTIPHAHYGPSDVPRWQGCPPAPEKNR